MKKLYWNIGWLVIVLWHINPWSLFDEISFVCVCVCVCVFVYVYVCVCVCV